MSSIFLLLLSYCCYCQFGLSLSILYYYYYYYYYYITITIIVTVIINNFIIFIIVSVIIISFLAIFIITKHLIFLASLFLSLLFFPLRHDISMLYSLIHLPPSLPSPFTSFLHPACEKGVAVFIMIENNSVPERVLRYLGGVDEGHGLCFRRWETLLS